jgi:hypothetical protein
MNDKENVERIMTFGGNPFEKQERVLLTKKKVF